MAEEEPRKLVLPGTEPSVEEIAKEKARTIAGETSKDRRPRGKRSRMFLTPQEEEWVTLYVQTGSKRAMMDAMQAAGSSYGRTASNAGQFLERKPVRERIKAIITRAQAEHIELSKNGLLSELRAILAQSRPFERVKSIELIGKFEGLFAPRHQITTHRTIGVSPYVELADTLKAGTKFAPEERAQMRQQLLVDTAAIQEVLALLEEQTASGPRAH